jgi:uncharacterized damage-inducible protein DinB
MNNIEEALGMWDVIRKGTISELENVPEGKWDFTPGEGARTVHELARHILEAASGFSAELVGDDPKFTRLFDPATHAKFLERFPDMPVKAQVIEQLQSESAAHQQSLRDAALGDKTMQSRGGTQSRLTGLWFAIAHEMYHRGQLATYARAIGVVPAMTQQMNARRS